jgi:glycosyltransferase involved in cell wall biosynthesis
MPPVRVVHMTSVHSALDHRIFKKECRSLAKAGFDVTVVGPHPEDTVEELVRIKSVKKHPSKLARMTRTVWNVFREAQKCDADIYHFHDPELLPAAVLLRICGRRVIYDVHEDFPKDVLIKTYLPKWSRRFIARIMESAELAACRRFSAVVCVTPSIAKRFEPANSRTVTLFNYPYPEELIGENPPSWESRNIAATYVGTITPQRGIAEMVRAMGFLSESLGATLEIAGDAMPEEVKAFPGWSRVRFHRALDQRSTYRLLRNVRVGLVCEHPIPTFLEAVPVKLFEYMGAGLPVIASDFPLWRKMLSDVECAIYVDPLDARGIAQAIEYLLTNPAKAEEMGRRGQAAVLKKFNWNTQARKLEDLYLSLASAPCAG